MKPIKLISALLACSAVGFAHASAPTEGKPVPSFTMKTLEGKSITSASLKGKVVLLDFWATWCGPCKMASPIMQKLSAKYGKKGLVVIGANTFERGDKNGANAKKYRAEHKFNYTFTFGNDGLAKSWGIDGIPQFYLIDKKGVVRMSQSGFDPVLEKEFEKKIEAALAGK